MTGELIKRLETAHRRMATALAGVHIDDLRAIREARDALEAAEQVIAPFADLLIHDDAEDWERMATAIRIGCVRDARNWLAAHATGQREPIRLAIPPMPEGAPAAWKHRDPATLYWLPVVLKGPCAVTQWCVETPCGKTTIIDAEDHAELVPVSTGQRQGGDDA